MPSKPPPGSIDGSPRIPAPFQLAPDSTGRTPRTPAPFQPCSTGGSSRTPAALSALATRPVTKKCTVLVDWCLERVEGEEGKIRVAGATYNLQMSLRKGASSSKGSRKAAGRVFRSSAIVKRLDYVTIESEDGYSIRIHNLLNIPKTRENGFSQEVCECFEFGFPIQWQSLVNPNMVPDNEHARSPSETTTNPPSHSVEYYMEKFLSDSFGSSIPYNFTKNDFDSCVGYSGNTDGLTTQCLSNLLDDNAGNITASLGLYGLKMDVPEKPLAPPGQACNIGQESYQHESTQIDASKQEIVNRSISSVSVKQSSGSISSNPKVGCEIPSVVNEGYRSTVGCGQAEEDADIQQENMHSCSSEHGMVTLPIDCTSSQLGEPGIPKSGKDSVNLGTIDALELPTEGMTPKFGVIRGSEDSTGRRLRSGKVLGMPSGRPMKRGHKQKEIHPEASSKQMVNQGTTSTSTADLTSHENDFSAAEVVAEEKLESHDSCRRGRGRPAKGKGLAGRGRPAKGKEKRKRNYLFTNWV